MVVSAAAQHGWEISLADVSTAFLQGMSFEELAKVTGEEIREVCFNPPKGSWKFLSTFPCMKGCSETTHLLALKKGVYGLKDAPRAWRLKIDQVLRELGGVPMKSEPCLYMWHNSKRQLTLICSTHVDDFKICGEKEAVTQLLQGLEKKVGKLKTAVREFEHCGIMHKQNDDMSINIHQNHYVQQLSAIPTTKEQDLEATCSPNDAAAYMSLLGGVAWVVNTRADVAIFVGALQRVAKSPRYVDIKRLNIVLKFLKRHPIETKFKTIKGPLRIVAISDSAFKRQDESPLACRGSMIVLSADNPENPGGDIHVIDYQSKKQKRVTRSTYGAEIHGLADTMEAARTIACAYTELYTGAKTFDGLCKIEDHGKYHFPIDACLDAKSVFDSIVVADLKRPAEASLINILGQMREHMACHRIRTLFWIDTRDMLADGLNKGAVSRKALMQALVDGTWQVVHPLVKKLSSKTIINESLDDELVISEQMKAMKLDDENELELSMERLNLDHFSKEIPTELTEIFNVMD